MPTTSWAWMTCDLSISGRAPDSDLRFRRTMASIRRSFPYIFDGGKKESNVPRLDARILDGAPFDLFGLEFLPIPVLHGSHDLRLPLRRRRVSHGPQRHSGIFARDAPVAGCPFPRRAALQAAPHAFHRDRSVKTAKKLAPHRAFFTHICHDLAHDRAESLLPPHIRLACDGLEILVGGVA